MGVTNFDVVQAAAFIGSDFLTQGKTFFVKPRTGQDGSGGLSPRRGVKTLLKVLTDKVTADQNDVVRFMAEGGSTDPSDTSDLLSATLDWNKNLVHLAGVSTGSPMGSRARIGFASDYVGVGNLFTVSGRSCMFKDLLFNVDVASANPVGCVNVTGARNAFYRCQFAGMCHSLLDTTGNYSLRVSGYENYFKDCVIGTDTITKGGGDNCELLLAGGGRNIFEDCLIVTLAEANTHQFVKRTAGDRFTLFKNCTFINVGTASAGVAMLEAIDVVSASGGNIVLRNCSLVGAAQWEAAPASGIVFSDGQVPAVGTGSGVMGAVTGA